MTGFEPTQTKAAQASVLVHASPSSQAFPSSEAHLPFFGAPAATEQASHAPALHAVSQQTPSAQKPLGQSAPEAHGSPRTEG